MIDVVEVPSYRESMNLGVITNFVNHPMCRIDSVSQQISYGWASQKYLLPFAHPRQAKLGWVRCGGQQHVSVVILTTKFG